MDKNLVKYSKRISKALHHKPETLGLVLDEHGWADVSKLIKALSANTISRYRRTIPRIYTE